MGVTQNTSPSIYKHDSFYFQYDTLTDANGTLETANLADTTYTAWKDGAIIGWSGGLNDALTTGTLTLYPTINGTVGSTAFSEVIDNTQQTAQESKEAFTTDFTFNAGDEIGLMWQKDGTVDPETTNLQVHLHVLYSDVRF
jgi:hypothetical protein